MSDPIQPNAPEQPQRSDAQPSYGQYAPDNQAQQEQSFASNEPQYGQRIPGYGQRTNSVPPLPQLPPQYDATGNRFGQEPPLSDPWYGIGFGRAIQRFFKKYAVFSGRASRSEVWWLVLFNALVSMALSPLGLISPTVNTWVGYAWELAVFIPWLALGVRRLHDANISGWLLAVPTVFTYGASIGLDVFVTSNLQDFLNYVTVNNTLEGYPADIQSTLILGCLFALMAVIGTILWVVLMCLGSKPQGARFDKADAQQFQNLNANNNDTPQQMGGPAESQLP